MNLVFEVEFLNTVSFFGDRTATAFRLISACVRVETFPPRPSGVTFVK